MKKKLITLIISGIIAGTALVGLAFQNNMESANNSNGVDETSIKSLDKASVESLDKTYKVEDKNIAEIDSYNKGNEEDIDNKKDGKEENTTTLSKGGQVEKLPSNENIDTNSKDKNIIKTEENSTTDSGQQEIEYNNPSTNTEKTQTPSQDINNKPVQSTPPASTSQGDFSAQIEQLIFTKVNEERSRAGMSTLSYSGLMEKYARIKSQDMGDRNYFDHKNPEGELITAQMARDGITYRSWGENIAYIGGTSDINELANMFMTNWMNSQGHRENILSPNFTSIGVGVYKSGNRYYASQEFYK